MRDNLRVCVYNDSMVSMIAVALVLCYLALVVVVVAAAQPFGDLVDEIDETRRGRPG
jgi:hypothetical protein